MIELLVIAVMALALLGYVAIPLIFPKHADPLPDMRDPELSELEGERDALLRAIQELEFRHDLASERREHLRARYEAKAAKVLRALDQRQKALQGIPVHSLPKGGGRRVPWVALSLLSLMVVSAVSLGGWVLPRLGSASVTVFFDEDVQAAQSLRRLERNAQAQPDDFASQLALAQRYWQLGQAEQSDDFIHKAMRSYEAAAELDDLPAADAFNMGLVTFQQDSQRAIAWLEQAVAQEPDNPDYLFVLAQGYYQRGAMKQALSTWQAYKATPEGAQDSDVDSLIANAQTIIPAIEAVNADANEDTLLALGETLWGLEEREVAAGVYLQLLLEHNNQQPVALSRLGQAVFMSGNAEEAVGFLSKAQELESAHNAPQLDTLLFLGNAYYSLGSYQAAIDTWQQYIQVAGGAQAAGRIPELIAQAEAALRGEVPATNTAPEAALAVSQAGDALYSQYCAACHGNQGQGGSGPRLLGHRRIDERDWLRAVIVNGRGIMPAYEAVLSTQELESLLDYLQQAFAR